MNVNILETVITPVYVDVYNEVIFSCDVNRFLNASSLPVFLSSIVRLMVVPGGMSFITQL